MNINDPNKKGAAMLWAVLSVLMMSLITAGIVFISHTYYAREENESREMQARLYAESAIKIIANDITAKDENSPYVSADNTSKTITAEFPNASNWNCSVTISHSLVNLSSEETKKKSGEIYLTAKVTRQGGSGKTIELAEVCAKLAYKSGGWEFEGYYNL